MKRLLVVFSLIVFLGVLFIILAPLLAKTNSPEFCAKCHVMEEQYLTLVKGGLHNSIRCVDCHLPNDSKANFYLWKGIDGTKDIIHFYFGSVPEKIIISSHGKKTVQKNCIRCHEGMVSRVEVSKRNCWDCHKRVTHKDRALLETI
ncbi:MAG: cytochrome c nitrite reductase small subunit [Syntrophobacterales bacterium]|nr:cytochrome c nitrite reductase small subunit [Syntrophobacterales bacterium]